MTQASFGAPPSDDGSNIDAKRSGRYKYSVRTQMLGLYKTDTEAPNAPPPRPDDGSPQPPALPSPSPSPAPDAVAALPPAKGNQVRFLWPATLPLPGQESERPSFAPGVQPARDAVWPATLRLGAHMPSNDTAPRDRMTSPRLLLPKVSVARLLVAIAGTAFAIALAFFFAYALRTSDGDTYVPPSSELPPRNAPSPSPPPIDTAETPPTEPVRGATPHEPTVVPVPKDSENQRAPSETQPAARAKSDDASAARGLATQNAAFRAPVRPRSGGNTARVPWWE